MDGHGRVIAFFESLRPRLGRGPDGRMAHLADGSQLACNPRVDALR